MAKFYGLIGYAETVETEPGIWKEVIEKRPYYGDIIKLSRGLQVGESINDNISLTNQISIVSDPYANEHFFNMRYVEFMNAKWKVSSVDVEFPRLILTLGGVYNE